ncbi:UNVERIFIED_CONTAM: hypothetical protein Cloal_2732 [Acetivibrio alkalicellulosi]
MHRDVDTRRHRDFPENIRELLKLLKGERVVIVLRSGQKQALVVEAVIGDLLVASLDKGILKFVDIDCICEVLAECGDVLGNILTHDKFKRLRGDINPEIEKKSDNAYGWQTYLNSPVE